MKMIVEFKDLRPNPFRDFAVDPIDGPENDNDETGYVSAVTKLRESIEEDGFWGGVVVRKHNGEYQIAAGHHRVEAAKLAGLTKADLVVLSLDDDAMIRVYARENATQRGQSSTAMTGSVAAALRKKAMDAALACADEIISANPMAREQPIGRPAIMEILRNVHGITENSVNEQLAILKSSGHYTRIMREVADEVQAEQERLTSEAKAAEKRRIAAEEAARKAAEEQAAREKAWREAKEERAKLDAEVAARKAEEAAKRAEQEALEARKQAEIGRRVAEQAEQASQRADATAQKAKDDPKLDRSFDYEGVSKWLHTDNQIRAFRKWCTAPGIKPYLPVESQQLIAKELAVHAAKHGIEPSGAFINTKATEMLEAAKGVVRSNTKKSQKDLQVKSWQDKADHWVQDFGRHCRGLMAAGTEIAALRKTQPKGTTFAISPALRTNIREARDVINKLYSDLYGDQ